MPILELFTHAGCLSGDHAWQLIRKVLQDFPHVSFRQVDMLQEPTRASEIGIQISPILVYNKQILFVGVPSEEKLREFLKAKEEVKK